MALCTPHGGSAGKVLDERAPVVSRLRVAHDTFELSFGSPRIAAAARPGQFVNVLLPSAGFGYRVIESGDPPPRQLPALLRRPFSIYRACADAKGAGATIDLLVKVVGRSSRRLVGLKPGTEVQILGPLGNGFGMPPEGEPAVLVAGGCGWASLGMLARELRRRDHPTYAFIGAETVDALPFETAEADEVGASVLDGLPRMCVTSRELEELGVVVALAAEQGGRVFGGFVTELLDEFLRGRHVSHPHVYACGPWGMLRHVAEFAHAVASPCQVALEERMGCGVGVCNSCVVDVFLPDGSTGHKKLCTDGPVLDAAEVDWEQERD